MAAFASAGKSMPGAHVSFDDLLEREWSANQPHAHTSSDGRKQVPKKPFLKRGARGWWKNSDKAVPMAYSLSSAHDDEQKGTATSKTTAFPSKQQRPSQASSQPRRTQVLGPSASSRAQVPVNHRSSTRRTTPTSSTAASLGRSASDAIETPLHAAPYVPSPRGNSTVLNASSSRYIPVAHQAPDSSNWSIHDEDNNDVRHDEDPPPDTCKYHEHPLTQSVDWKLEQDAHELQEFESLEQQLLQQHTHSTPHSHQLDDTDVHADPSAAAGTQPPPPWRVDEETERRDLLAELDAWSRDDITTRPPAASLYDQDLYDLNHSFSIDGHGDDEVGELSHHQSSMLHYPHHDHIEALNEGSLNDVSFADSEPWDEYDQGPAPIMAQERLDLTSNVHSVAEPHQESANVGQQPSYIEQKFQKAAAAANQMPPPPVSSSLQTLKMKLKQKAAASSRTPAKPTGKKSAGKIPPLPPPPPPPGKVKREKSLPGHHVGTAAAATAPHSVGTVPPPKPSSSHFPAGIEDKLFELETEVKHYKQETLKLQKRREALEADQRKLDQQRHDWHEEKRKAQEDMDAQWKHLRKERRALDQALKFGAAALPDRKERGEIDALKAQLVKMQVDDKAKTNKHKAATDFFRHRIAERLANWNWTNDASNHNNNPGSNQSGKIPSRPGPGTAPISLASSINYNISTSDAPMKKDKSTTVDEDAAYNPAQYQPNYGAVGQSKDKSDSRRTNGSETHHSDDGDQHKNDLNGAFGLETTISDDGHETPDDQATPSLSELHPNSSEVEEIRHSGGKVERRYASGPLLKSFQFANGTEKDVYKDGHSVVRFSNGDVKETYPGEGGKTVYFYAAAQTRHVTYADDTQVFEFPNGQVETHHANGAKEISFVDGTTKRIETNGDEWSTFPDGTRMVEAKSGFREVINPDGSRARDYPDGRTTWITPQGVEQPVQYKRPTA
ncbi:hypothetical protein, variant [Aphanomyces astaci]|uniref:Centromere protein J C-terminal domain-containing protein n=1 Tax=Aphanomyces astaci TaxID=112090 RepID=W4GP42_APHAT|nr:hypothetical protein, variant [Aphanomyces astaci]ETV81091.1 hypothetical protein, variant [Aphanomyces astaci]|eukprot:XP_009828949.1 hypothetical protein, variant [Aphanomyces astaci]